MWKCVCDCGNLTIVRLAHLNSGATKSCGCLREEVRGKSSVTHGMSRTPEHKTWLGIRARCYDPKHISYKYYGERGVTVCERWRNSFEDFHFDMGSRPSKEHSLERKDHRRGYNPENCVWADEITQQNNKRNTRFVTYKGQRLSVANWDRKLGLKRNTIGGRVFARGWSAEEAIEGKRT